MILGVVAGPGGAIFNDHLNNGAAEVAISRVPGYFEGHRGFLESLVLANVSRLILPDQRKETITRWNGLWLQRSDGSAVTLSWQVRRRAHSEAFLVSDNNIYLRCRSQSY